MDYERNAVLFKALSDPRRLKILALLQSGEKCTCILTKELNLPQSSLSYHMKILTEAGLTQGREDGKWTHYQISREGSKKALEILAKTLLVLPNASGLTCLCKEEHK